MRFDSMETPKVFECGEERSEAPLWLIVGFGPATVQWTPCFQQPKCNFGGFS